MKKNKIILICILTLIAFLAGFAGIKYYKNHTNNTPESAFNSFVYALNHDYIDGMLNYLEPTEAEVASAALAKIDEITDSQIATTLVKWLPFLSDFTDAKFLPKLNPTIQSVSEENNKATITVSIDNTDVLYDVYMIKIDTKWYIQYAWKANEKKG